MKFNLAQQQIFLLIIIFIATAGTTISFSIFAPLFLHPDANSIISPNWNHEVRSIFLGMVIASYPLGNF
jgi:DHA1 family tetracycline resistance protein-like MFS transporter